MDNKKKTGILLSLLGILSLVLITVGVTYAFFNYARQGTTENTITTGSITFIYEEVDAQGSGISIENAFPISDEVGKIQSASGEVFNFKVTSNSGNYDIPYTITARMSSDSTLSQNAVKVYLTEVSGDTETSLTESIYEDLTDYSKAPANTIEKVLHTNTVNSGTTNYEKNYKLRMWIPDSIDFSPVQDENGNDTYPYNGKKFTLTVNVYANAEVVSVPDTPSVDTTTPSVETMTSSVALSIGDAVTAIDGSKWHVLEASTSGTDTVVLLSDYNLNTDGTYNTECGRNISSNPYCNTMAFGTGDYDIYDETDSSNIGYFIKNTYEPLVTKSLSGTTNVTLPTAEQLALADSQTYNQNSLTITSSWLITTNYWAIEASNLTSAGIWYLDEQNTYLSSYGATTAVRFGARPVITTPKTNGSLSNDGGK